MKMLSPQIKCVYAVFINLYINLLIILRLITNVLTPCIATCNSGVGAERNSESTHSFGKSDSHPQLEVSARPSCVLMSFHQQMLLWISGLGIPAWKRPL